MKWKVIFLLCLSVCLIFSGCAVSGDLPDLPESLEKTDREPDRNREEIMNESAESGNSSSLQTPIPEIEIVPDTVSLTSHSDWMFEEKEPVILLKSYEELLAYREQLRIRWEELQIEDFFPMIGQSILISQLDTYEASYFDTHMLAVLCLQEGSGGNRVSADGVGYDGNEMIVFVTRDKCGITCDMLYWYLFVGVEARQEISSVRMLASEICSLTDAD